MPAPNHAPSPSTLQDAIETYLAEIRRNASPHLTAAYQQALKLFIEMLASQLNIKARSTPITELRVGWAEDYLRYLQAERAVETEHLYSRAVLDFYTTAEQNGWANVDASQLATYLRKNRRPKQHRIPDPPVQAISTIVDYAASMPVPQGEDINERDRLRILRDKAFILTLADTGLKVSEICDLRRKHVNLAQQLLHFDSIPLSISPRTAQAIQSYLAARQKLDAQQRLQPDHGELALFARHDKRASSKILPISRWTASNIVDEWVRLALPEQMRAELEERGQVISPQTFRHYFVVTMLEQTGDLSTTQTLARHSDPSTTRRYMQYLEETGQLNGAQPEQKHG